MSVYIDASMERVERALKCSTDLVYALTTGRAQKTAYRILQEHGYKDSLFDFAKELEALRHATFAVEEDLS